MSAETFTQLRILSGHSHRTGVGMTLAHHHTSQNNQRRGSESKLIGSQKSHADDIASGLQLAVGLKTYHPAKLVKYQSLLGLAHSHFRRSSGIAYRRCRRSTRTSLGTGDHNQVGLGFSYTRRNGSHSAFGHQLHADLGTGIHILEIENQLSQIFNGINIVMRRRRNQRYARNGMTRTGYYFIYFESRKLAAFTGLGSLSHLDLDLFGMYQVFRSHTETSGSHLFGLARQGNAVERFTEPGGILSTFSRIAPASELVHGQRQCFVSLLADRSERNCSRDEPSDDVFHRFHLFQRNGVAAETEEITQEQRFFFPVNHRGKFLKLGITSQTGSHLQSFDYRRCPGVFLTSLAICKLTDIGQAILTGSFFTGRMITFSFRPGCLMESQTIMGHFLQTNTSDGRHRGSKIITQEFGSYTHGFENLRSAVRADGTDTHLAHNLIKSLAQGAYIVLFGGFIVELDFPPGHQTVKHGKSHIRIDGTRTITK